ncbi:ABC transporter ATP-binding protein [Anaeropeptidivorans aminofermentans]|uniref:ABC transporter ATP-binding protein n=1 Tax=Anaeropeptidivorans aminofermentans TaxID=2934315 RepID=UPI0020242E77|nr:ABC transporter ATP-binding protein [Anaeropeptidivorans aminofermentans]
MRKVLPYIKPYQKLFVIAVFFLILQNSTALLLPTFTANIINIGVQNKDLDYIYHTGALMLIITILGGISAVISTIFASKATASFGRDLREAIFLKAQKYSLSDFQKISTASMINRCTNDITTIQRSLMMFLRVLLPAPIMTMVGLVLAFRTNAKMALFFIGIIVIFAVLAFLIGKKAIPLFKEIQKRMDNLTYVLRETITGVRVIRAFNKESFEKERFENTCDDFKEISIKTNKIFAMLLPTLFLVSDLSVASIVWFGGIQVSQGSMQVGSIFALIEYITIILFCGIMAVLVFMEVPRALSCVQRLNEVLDLEPEIKDRKESVIKEDINENVLEFKNVTFQYPGAENAVLSDISFKAMPGETTAVIGGTGSGKSTVANLIPRFYNIQKGEITIGGINIENYTQHDLRKKLGFIPQKAFLFSGTVEGNIKYGKINASREEVIHAAKIAQAHDFISKLEKGYDSFVAQGGTNFSGGQKQRIAIARALVRKPGIYIFDDSFSALDFKTDALLRKALKPEVKNATLLIVAQRISTIMDADQIIVLNEGKIVGKGKHQELLKSCSVYQQIAASQLSEKDESLREVV